MTSPNISTDKTKNRYRFTLNQTNLQLDTPLSSNLVNSNTVSKNTYSYTFPYQLHVKDESSRISLSDISIYNSFLVNISASLGNNTIRVTRYITNITAVPLNIIYPDGYYTIQEIIDYFYLQLTVNGWYLVDNYNNKVFFHRMFFNPQNLRVYFRVLLIPNSLPSGWQAPNGWNGYPQVIPYSGGFYFPTTNTNNVSMGTFFGLNSNTYYPWSLSSQEGLVESPILPKSTSINSFIIRCSLINNIGLSNIGDIVYTKAVDPNTFGELLTDTEKELKLIPLQRGVYQKITFQFFDNLYRPLNILDSNLTFSLVLTI